MNYCYTSLPFSRTRILTFITKVFYCRKDAKNKGENITSKSSKCKVRKIVLAFKGTYTIWKRKIEK